MKVEVQLRTIAMDFWASLEHKLRYKKEIPEFEKDSLQKELFECAQMINTLDQRMEAVKNRLAAGGNGRNYERKIGKKSGAGQHQKRCVCSNYFGLLYI